MDERVGGTPPAPASWSVTTAVVWLAAAPWLMVLVRSLRWPDADAEWWMSVLLVSMCFLATYPTWLVLLGLRRAIRSWTEVGTYTAIVAVPSALVAATISFFGTLSDDAVTVLMKCWLVTATVGIGLARVVDAGDVATRRWSAGDRWAHRQLRREARTWRGAVLMAAAPAGVVTVFGVLIAGDAGWLGGWMVFAGTCGAWFVDERTVETVALVGEVVLTAAVLVLAAQSVPPGLVAAAGMVAIVAFLVLVDRTGAKVDPSLRPAGPPSMHSTSWLPRAMT